MDLQRTGIIVVNVEDFAPLPWDLDRGYVEQIKKSLESLGTNVVVPAVVRTERGFEPIDNFEVIAAAKQAAIGRFDGRITCMQVHGGAVYAAMHQIHTPEKLEELGG